jgi:HlyD family secretion protein
VRPGQNVDFTVDAYPGATFTGVVAEVRLASSVVQNVVTYPVIISVSNPDLKLMPGMTANVSITVAEKHDVLRITSAALRFQPPEKQDASNGKKAVKSGSGSQQQSNHGNDNQKKPSPAFKKDPNSNKVFILQNNEPAPVDIVTGVDNGEWTEIVSGNLTESSEIITSLVRNSTDKQSSSNPFSMSMRGGPRH